MPKSKPKTGICRYSRKASDEKLVDAILFNPHKIIKAMGNYIFLSKDTGTMEQTLQVLTRIQRFYINDELGRMWLVCEDWDWLAILQWLQDNGLFKNNPKRPPLKAFENWLNENNVPHVRAHYTAYEMSLAHRRIGGARYPWNDVNVDLGMIRRWRIMYNQLSRLLV